MSVIVPFSRTMQMALQSDASESDVPDSFISNVFWQSAPSGLVHSATCSTFPMRLRSQDGPGWLVRRRRATFIAL